MPTTYKVTVYSDRTEWENEAGQLHREGGLPAYEDSDGYKAHYLNDKCHNDKDAAVEWPNGTKEYWLNDEELTYDQWLTATQPPKEMTVADIEKALGHKVKVIK